jgi:hypothetical protein
VTAKHRRARPRPAKASSTPAARPARGASPAPAAASPPPPSARLTTVALAATVVVAAVALPSGPFAFLPAATRWPLALLVALTLGWPLLEERGWRAPPWLGTVVEGLALTAVLGSYALLKLVGLHPSGTDDNIYFYLATRVSQGAVPYRDFFFAHAPVHLLVPAAVFKVTGFHIVVAKAIPAVAQAVAGLFLYLTLRRASRALAGAALLLHLLAYQVLMASTDMNGENLMTAFLMASLYAAVRGRALLAGVLAGLALGTGLYALAGVLTLLLAAAFASRRTLARFGLGLVASFGALLLLFGLLGGHGFFEGVFAYHLSKPVKGGRLPVFASGSPAAIVGAYLHNLGLYLGTKELKKSLFFHAPTYLAAVLGAGLVVGRALHARIALRGGTTWRAILTPRDLLAGTPEGLAKLGLLAALLFTAQWAGLNEVYDFYSVPMLAFLAIPAGYALWDAFRRARAARRLEELRLSALVVALFALHLPLASALDANLWPEEQRQAGQVVRYQWHDPEALPGLAAVTRALFFSDHRVKGATIVPFRHYLWNKLLTFSTVAEIAGHIRERTRPDETITGASTLAPLVALYAGRRLAGDDADTNNKRFVSGVISDAEFFARACRDRIRYVLAAPRSHFSAALMATEPTARASFTVEREVVDTRLLHGGRPFRITLYRRGDRPGLPAGVVCAPR